MSTFNVGDKVLCVGRNFDGVRFDDFLCMDAFRMGIKSKDDLRRYSIEELEKMCPKDKRLFVRLKKLKAVYG